MKTTGAAAPLIITTGCGVLSSNSKARPGWLSPNDRLNIACVGVGGKGRSDVSAVSTEYIIGLCDPDMGHATVKKKGRLNAFEMHPKAEMFLDYRRMLDKLGNSIDAVTVSTPDHTHFPPAMRAVEMGKHAYVQKPLTHTIWEARELTKAARKHGVATIMGNQGRAGEGARLVREWVQGGAIGDVREVHLWTNRPDDIWVQGVGRPKEVQRVPDSLDWNLWLGTAPKRPYNAAYLPGLWRGWWDFGCGALGDMGCHVMDCAYWALDLDKVHPTSVDAKTSPVNNETAPLWSIVTYKFPARGSMPPVTVKWYDGGKLPPRPRELEKDRDLATNGQLIVGDKATIYNPDAYCKSPRIIPEAKMQEMAPSLPPKTIPRIDGSHRQEWIRACKGGVPAGSNFDYAGPLTEAVLLGNLAIRTGKKIEWDGDNLRVTNVEEANQYVRTEFRNF